MIKVLICDDEPLARERLKTMLGKIQNIIPVENMAANGAEALELVKSTRPDVVLLDIHMPKMDGMECARKISELDTPPAVIFCTAYDQHALEAFKAQATDYLLKPVRRADLEQALTNAQRLTRTQIHAAEIQPQPPEQELIAAHSHKGTELIPVHDVYLFQADHKYVTVYHRNGEVLISEPLKSLQEKYGHQFIRIHRNALVAHSAIQSMNRDEQGCYELHVQGMEQTISVSRRHASSVRRLLRSLGQ